MRENMGLYHGKRTDTNEWIEGCLVVDEKGNTYIGRGISAKSEKQFSYGGRNGKTFNRFAAFGFFMVNPETVGQYTGLTDKNGKKIFEGDIVVIGNQNKHPTLIKFADFGWCCVIPNINAFIHYRHSLENNNTKYEVIGNIHDNPELLKGGAE